ncbi:MAG: LamG-like jellyroll fold domain-containing protein, partial [Chloroflexota bacterium]|nr:LamG-like jellyroll fold domain-containing protein [Chloroflexota bacterium]
MVKLTDDPDLSLTSVGENGMGIRFSSPTWDFLDFEIEQYVGDKTDGSLVAWVKIPTLDFDDNTPFYIHYGQPIGNGTASLSYNNVWAGNTAKGFVVVNHLSDSTDTNPATRELKGSATSPSVSDASTKDDFSVVNMASNGQVDAKIGKGIELDGSDDYVCLDHSSGDGTDNFNCSGNESSTLFDSDVVNRTTSLWYNADTVTGDRKMYTLFEEGGSGNGLNIYLYEGKLYAGAWVGNTDSGWVSIATTANEWHHVAFVFSDHNNDEEIKMYYDGQTSNALTIDGFNMGSHSNDDCLGANCRSTEIHLGDSGHSNANDDDAQ